MDAKEKLKEILAGATVEHTVCTSDGVPVSRYLCRVVAEDEVDIMADYLLDNGVTFATDNNVGGKWIPVTERLPNESSGTVLVCLADKQPYNIPEPFPHAEHDRRVVIGSYSEHTGTWYCSMGGTLHDVTHWMPLPEPPMRKGENE